jgi:hypothetical protein
MKSRKKRKNVIQIINGAVYSAHTESRFEKSEIMPLNLLIIYLTITIPASNFLNGNLPTAFNNAWTLHAERRIHHGGLVR